jgi:diguanylate cyclase (GGDEF)-like protein
MRYARRYLALGALTGLIAPVGLFAGSVFTDRVLDPAHLFGAMALGGIAALGLAGWVIGKKEDVLASRNRELRRISAQLRALSATDGLTDIANRRTFDERIAVELAQATRYGTRLSLVMVDIDHFKHLNDNFGHRAGDEVLRQVAKRLEAEKRVGDLVARYGGEEFVAILPHTDAASAAAWAERARERISAAEILAEGQALHVTASFGVAEEGPNTGTPEALVAAADAAMYEAKSRGRNRVVVRPSGPTLVADSTTG